MRAVFTGCSFTVGEGFPVDQRDFYIYDRLLSKHCNFERVNIAAGGSSNYKIFMSATKALTDKACDILFVQWSALNRMWLSPGPDTYFFINDPSTEFRYRDLYISNSDRKYLKNLILLLNHDYQNIFDLVDYCKFLDLLATHQNIKLVFINGIVPWSDDLITIGCTDLQQHLSNYTKAILDFNNRSDEEIHLYFNKLQSKIAELDQCKWVNLFDSFQKNITDVGPEGHHPGIKSHQWMADQIITHLTERKII